MTRKELSFALQIIGVEKQAYSPDSPVEQTWCVTQDSDRRWSVYWLERGNRNHLIEFRSESDACFWLLGRLSYSQILARSSTKATS